MTPTEARSPRSWPDALLLSAPTVPFTSTDTIDRAALAEHLTWLAEHGVDGVFAGGSTGEFTTLDDDERAEVFGIALDVFGPERVIAHIGAASTRQALRIAELAVAVGARRFAAITPYYQPSDPAAVTSYYGRLADRVGEIHAYLFPARTATAVAPDEFGRLVTESGVRGAKISGVSKEDVLAYRAVVPGDIPVFTGNDPDIAGYVVAGGTGGISGMSSAFPTPFVRLRDALRTGELDAVEKAQQLIARVARASAGATPSYLKAALELQGLRGGHTRVAVDEPGPQQRAELRSAVEAALAGS